MTPTVYCRRCSGLVSAGADYCPSCGVGSPAKRPAFYGILTAGAVVASAVTGLFVWVIHRHWDRWESRFEGLSEDHPFANQPEHGALFVGVGLFVVVWLLSAWVLRNVMSGRSR